MTNDIAPAGRPRPHRLVACLLGGALSGALAFAVLPFATPEEALSTATWGAGTPTTASATAFATLGPWWRKHTPDAIVPNGRGGIEPVVRVPRSAVAERPTVVLPTRGIGYDMLLGAATAARSLFSPDLVFDFALVIRLQQASLLVALALMPVALYAADPRFRTPKTFAVYGAAYMIAVAKWPDEPKYVTDGIVDSALANALALASAAALVLVVKNLSVATRRSALTLVGASLLLGYAALVRGEFLFVVAFAYMFIAVVEAAKAPGRLKGLALSAAVWLAPATLYGFANEAIFGHFVPLRMQSGQNLVEPIGQYPNPYGIAYDDAWADRYLAEHGIEYRSFEADPFLTALYFKLLKEDPGLFVRNFRSRLRFFRDFFGLPIGPWTLALALAGALYGALRDQRFLLAVQPFVLALGYVVFFAWTNQLPRLVAPVHFLVNVSLCYASVYLVAYPGCGSRRSAACTSTSSRSRAAVVFGKTARASASSGSESS